METKNRKKILVAPLNWGLGHATRCIPIIESLLRFNFEPVLAGDGASLQLLQHEFPGLTSYNLPSTRILYAEKAHFLKFKLLSQAPRLLRAVEEEKRHILDIHLKEGLSGIISDNRFGARLREIPSVYITHQLQVLSGSTSSVTSALHQRIIAKFDQCWIPDDASHRLSGKLSTPSQKMNSIRFIGPLSRFTHSAHEKVWDILVVLSGPEPQRTNLERIIRSQLKSFSGKCMVVRGIVEKQRQVIQDGHCTVVNFMLQKELERTIQQSKMVVTRSGYSTIMDLNALGAKVFFIPTPGQYEQEYLASYLKEKGWADYSEQETFRIENLQEAMELPGFRQKKTSKNNLDGSLFDVFEKVLKKAK